MHGSCSTCIKSSQKLEGIFNAVFGSKVLPIPKPSVGCSVLETSAKDNLL
jgi:hypothetical protein